MTTITALNALGTKRTCCDCKTRFFDLNKKRIICPKCNNVHIPVVKIYGRRTRRAADKHADGDILLRHMTKHENAKPHLMQDEKESIGSENSEERAYNVEESIEAQEPGEHQE